MRNTPAALLVLSTLLGCTAPQPEAVPAASPAPGTDACVAAVAAHVGRPLAEVVVVAADPASVTVRDDARVHRCDLAGGRVTAILHPEAAG